jgi:hypothetical protein
LTPRPELENSQGHERPIDGGLDESAYPPDSDGIVALPQVTFRAIFGPNASQQNSARSITSSASNCIELGMFDLLRYRSRDKAALLCAFRS